MGIFDNNIGQGAIGGAATGAAFGGWGALAGGAIGGLLGAFTEEPPTADELGIVPIDARAMAQEFLPSEDEMRTQRNDFATRQDQSSERTAENMIAAGMDPARAYAIASRNQGGAGVRNERNQNAQRMTMMNQLASQFMPYQMQRDEDILNYNMSIENQPGILESFIPIAADMWSSQGLSNWGDGFGGAPKTPSAYNTPNGGDDVGFGALSRGGDLPAVHNFGQNVLSQPTPYYNELNGWGNLDN